MDPDEVDDDSDDSDELLPLRARRNQPLDEAEKRSEKTSSLVEARANDFARYVQRRDQCFNRRCETPDNDYPVKTKNKPRWPARVPQTAREWFRDGAEEAMGTEMESEWTQGVPPEWMNVFIENLASHTEPDELVDEIWKSWEEKIREPASASVTPAPDWFEELGRSGVVVPVQTKPKAVKRKVPDYSRRDMFGYVEAAARFKNWRDGGGGGDGYGWFN